MVAHPLDVSVRDDSLHEATTTFGSERGIRMGCDSGSVVKGIVICLHICHDERMNTNPEAQCTCTNPAVACSTCLANRDRNGWPKNWRERMSTPVCPACGKSGVVVGLDSVLLETAPAVRPHVCGIGGPGSSK